MFLCLQEVLCLDGKRCCPEGHLCGTDGHSCVKTGEILFCRHLILRKQPQKAPATISSAPKAAGQLQHEPRYVNLLD